MNLNPRLPDLPEAPYGVDPADHPVTLDFMRQFYERYYRGHRDLVQTLTPCTPVYGVATLTATFAVPGDLVLTFAVSDCLWMKLGRMVSVDVNLFSSAFTFTTASGTLVISGMPFIASNTTNYNTASSVEFQGITKAGYTAVFARLSAGSSSMTLEASGSGSALSTIKAADTPTGGTLVIRGRVTYLTDD